MRKNFFPTIEGPLPLKASISRTVRFEECDPLSIVWHGRYASYLEDAREALGQKYGISYLDFKKANVALPIKVLHLDYCKPLFYRETFVVNLMLHWSDAARINIEYEIYNDKGELVTRAYSVQLMVDLCGVFLLDPPEFYQAFRKRWEAGEVY